MLPRGEHVLEIVTERMTTRAVRVAGYMTSSVFYILGLGSTLLLLGVYVCSRFSAMEKFMRMAAEILFVFSVISIWIMLLYQFVLTIGGFLWRVKWLRAERRAVPPVEWPGVSILIPARNEGKVILGLLDHLLAMDYPRDRLEIIVINDGSSDGTADLVRRVQKTPPACGWKIYRRRKGDGARASC